MRIDSKAVSVMGRPGRRVLDMTGTSLLSLGASTDDPYHFDVSVASTTTVTVRGGTLETFANGSRYGTLLTCDAGASGDVTNVKTCGVAGDGVNYVILTKDSALIPTALAAACSLTAPTSATKLNRLIAHVTVSGGVIVAGSLVQDWNGGNIREYWNQEDDLSLNYNAAGTLQDKAWATAASIGALEHLGTNDLFMFQDKTTVGELLTKKYVSWDKLIDEMIDAFEDHHYSGPTDDVSININNTTDDELQLYEFDSASGAVSIASGDLIVFKDISEGKINYISFETFAGNVSHDGLSDISTGTANDDHDGGLGDGLHTGNHPYISGKGRACTGSPANTVADGNAFAAGSGIGAHDYALSIDPDGRKLYNGASSSLRATLDWYNRTLHGDWTQYDTASHFFVKGTEAITPGTFATGALRVDGGASVAGEFQAAGLYVTGTSPQNKWTASALTVYVSSTIGVTTTGGNLTLSAAGGAGAGTIEATAKVINLWASEDLSLQFDPGRLFINSSAWQEETVTVIKDGSEVTRTILAKVP